MSETGDMYNPGTVANQRPVLWPIRGEVSHRGHLTRGQGSLAGDIRTQLSGVFTFHSLYMLPVIWCWAEGNYGGFFPLFPLFSFLCRELVVPKDRRSLLDYYDFHFHNLRKLRQWLWWLLCSNNYRTEMIITEGWHDDMGVMMWSHPHENREQEEAIIDRSCQLPSVPWVSNDLGDRNLETMDWPLTFLEQFPFCQKQWRPAYDKTE